MLLDEEAKSGVEELLLDALLLLFNALLMSPCGGLYIEPPSWLGGPP